MLKLKNSLEVRMNTESRQVFEALQKLTENAEIFKVVEADEIIDMLPQGASTMTKQELYTIIRGLRDEEYVKVKYFTPDEYCIKINKELEIEEPPVAQVLVTPIEEVAESMTEMACPVASEENEIKTENGSKDSKIKTMFYAMFGGIIGGAIVTAIAIIIIKLAV